MKSRRHAPRSATKKTSRNVRVFEQFSQSASQNPIDELIVKQTDSSSLVQPSEVSEQVALPDASIASPRSKRAQADNTPELIARGHHHHHHTPISTSVPAIWKNSLDIKVLASIARASSSISPMSMLLAGLDWAGHLAMAPGKRIELLTLALQQIQETIYHALEEANFVQPMENTQKDRRFFADAWQMWPFNYWYRNFLMGEAWWKAATHNIPGLTQHHEHLVSFVARQILDTLSPANYLMTNPLVLQKTMASGGSNLVQGYLNLLQDIERHVSGQPPVGAEQFIAGKQVAVTEGKVILQNRLIELIQYSPTTQTVHAEPILIVPAWIMKYYILDLSPHNSLVKFLVDQGFTVFCISWKNPSEAESSLGMDDYLRLGIYAALDAIHEVCPEQKIHAAGYCLGGTLLSIASAALQRDQDDCLASVTLFTAQTSFSEPGELALFIDESQVSMLEAQMRETGFLTAGQMAGAFQLLRSYDLLWSKMVNEYLLGERRSMNDLMAWNADATRMPAKMHAQYLRRLFLNDDLAQGRYPAFGKPVSLSDIRVPIFCVATLTDHVAPWSSVYKLHYLTGTDLTFVLTNGGHNAGIVSEPGRKNRRYQLLQRKVNDPYLTPADWLKTAPSFEGSWWTAWVDWLASHSTQHIEPPTMGPAICDAPGTYVFEK